MCINYNISFPSFYSFCLLLYENVQLSHGSYLLVCCFSPCLCYFHEMIQGRIDVLETVIQGMHWEKIKPDPSTCSYVFSAYVDCEYFGTAVEALQVLSMRMISLDQDTVEDFRKEFEDLIYAEEQEAETRIVQIFRDSVNLGAALLNLRWCSLVGSSISWMPDQSLWAIRLASAPAAQSTVVK